jgi:predicted dehydrogenase
MLIKYVLREPDVALRGVADLRPGRARFVADLYGFQLCSTEAATIIDDDATDCVFVVTDHHSHAALAVAALLAGKSVFVEKPPAVNPEQLRTLLGAMAAGHTSLQVGYNRNFAPLIHRLREHLDRDTGPTETRIDRRPYPVTPNSWYYWPKEGTRIVSNACHFLDVAYRIAGRPQPLSVTAMAVPDGRPDEHATIAAQFEDGSLCTIRFSNDVAGDEMLFARRGRRSACLRGFAHLELYDGNQMVAARTQEPDFGHAAEVEDFLRGCRSGGRAFCSPRDLAATSMLTFAADESLRLQRTINVVTAA